MFRETTFDREEVDRALEAAQDNLCPPRYQFDLISGEFADELDRRVPPVEPAAGVLALDRETGDVHHLSPDAAELLRSCDGTRTVEDILAPYGAEHAAAAREFLEDLAGAGLLRPARNPEEVPA